MKKPYIGVSGVTRREEADYLLQRVPSGTDYILQLGVQMSGGTLRGELNNYPNQFPVREIVSDIFPAHSRAFNVIHYHSGSRNPEKLLADLEEVVEVGGNRLHGIQLNMVWPSPEAVFMFKRRHPCRQIILQLNREAMELVSNSPARAAMLVARYENTLDYVLFDPSAGTGLGFDPEEARGYLNALRPLDIGLGVAGGLGQGALGNVALLMKESPALSMDAQKRLQDGAGRLSLSKSVLYLGEAFALSEQASL